MPSWPRPLATPDPEQGLRNAKSLVGQLEKNIPALPPHCARGWRKC